MSLLSLTDFALPVLLIVGAGGYMWFRWSDDYALKVRWWKPFTLGIGLCLAAYFYFRIPAPVDNAGVNNGALLAVGVAVLFAIISHTTRFCPQCSMMEVRKRRWFTDGDICRRCGYDLQGE